MKAWNGWYHVNGNSYGTWLPGDPRGWRSRKHKLHVDGDYRNPPPPGTDAGLLAHSKKLLSQEPVNFARQQRELVGRSLIEMLLHQQIEVIAVSVSTKHFHILAKFPDANVRPKVGRAKKHASFTCRERGFEIKLWAASVKVTPVNDRRHQVNIFNYIRRHENEGAWIWTFRDGTDWPTTLCWKENDEAE